MSIILPLLIAGGVMFSQGNTNPFVPIDHPILHQKIAEVPVEKIKSEEVQEIIDYMLILSKGERTDVDKKIMVGLAAPQIGIDLRIIIVDLVTGADRKDIEHDLQAFINPTITWASEETDRGREGCYSAGDFGGIVPRSTSVQISVYDRDWNPVEKKV